MRALCLRVLVVLLAFAGAPAGAQAQDVVPPPPPIDRDSLEARVRQRMASVIQRQVGLTNDQMRQLNATNRRFEGQRRDLVMREREIRMGLRDEIESGDTTRQAQVGRLLDQMLQLQRQRLELVEAEQKELATFMSPLQRARYYGLEEQIRRRVIEMREQGMRNAPGGRRPGGVAPGARPGAGAPRGGVRRPGAGAA